MTAQFALGQAPVINVSGTVTNAGAARPGINLGSFVSYEDYPQKNFMMAGGDPGFETPAIRQIFAVGVNGLQDTYAIQANCSNCNFDGAPLNYYVTNPTTLTVNYSTGAELGCTSTISASTQASSVMGGTISNLSLSGGTITATFAKTSGANQVNGATVGLQIAGATGGTGTINRIVAATIVNATTFTYAAAGENPSGASFGSATVSTGQGVTYFLTSPCSTAISTGDQFILSFTTPPGATLHTTGSAVVSYETSDVCTAGQTTDIITGGAGPGCGVQALSCVASGTDSCFIQYTLDNSNSQNFLLRQGTYTRSVMSKGTGTTVWRAERLGGANTTFTYTNTGAWTQNTSTNAENETGTSATIGNLILTVTMIPNGTSYMDNLFYGQNDDPSNQTKFRNEFVNALKALKPGTCRDWDGGGKNAMTYGQFTSDLLTQAPSAAGLNQVRSFASVKWPLKDVLELDQAVGCDPIMVIPGIATPSEIAQYVNYLHTNGWDSVFGSIRLSLCNESWNSLNIGQCLGFRSGSGNIYKDYTNWSTLQIAAGKAASGYSSKIKFVVGAQTALSGSDSVLLATNSNADEVELNGYYQNHIEATYSSGAGSVAQLAAYQPALSDAWAMNNYANDQEGFNGQMTALRAASIPFIVYEQNWGTGNSGCNQNCMDTTGAARVGVLTSALQDLENLQSGVNVQNVFTSLQYTFQPNTAPNNFNFKGWGILTDVGGQASLTNSATFGGSYNPRPTFIGQQMVANAVIGPRITTSVSNNTTYTPIQTAFNCPLTSLTGTGTIVMTVGTCTSGTFPAIGTQTTMKFSGVSGGTGLTGNLFQSVVTGANTATFTAAGVDSTGATLTSPTLSSGGNEVPCTGCNTPLIRAHAFKSGNNVALAIACTDPVNSCPSVTFAGALAPTGTVNLVKLNSGTPLDTNEAASLTFSGNYAAQVFPVTSTLTSFNPASSFPLDPMGLYVLSYTVSAASNNVKISGAVKMTGNASIK